MTPHAPNTSHGNILPEQLKDGDVIYKYDRMDSMQNIAIKKWTVSRAYEPAVGTLAKGGRTKGMDGDEGRLMPVQEITTKMRIYWRGEFYSYDTDETYTPVGNGLFRRVDAERNNEYSIKAMTVGERLVHIFKQFIRDFTHECGKTKGAFDPASANAAVELLHLIYTKGMTDKEYSSGIRGGRHQKVLELCYNVPTLYMVKSALNMFHEKFEGGHGQLKKNLQVWMEIRI